MEDIYSQKIRLGFIFNTGEVWSASTGWQNVTEYSSPSWKKYSRRFLKPLRFYGGKNLLVWDSFSQGYFHWIADVLPKLFLLKDELADWEVLLPEKLQPYEEDSLRLFQIKRRRLPNRFEIGIAPFLNVIKLPWQSGYFDDPLYDIFIPWLVNESRKFNSEISTVNRHSKIFINRREAATRRILNNDSIEPLLISKGFHTAEVSGMKFMDQALFFQNCNYLIAPHGAGLINMIYMPKGSTIVELRSSYPIGNNIYERLAKKMGHHYIPIISTAPNYAGDFQEADIYVPTEELERVINC